MPPAENRLIRDRYWILSTLASGGMGDTYRVWDVQQRIPAVIKMPRSDARNAADAGRRFVQELHAMLALKHEHIVPITDYGDDGDRPFVVMRFLPGGSLADYRDFGAGTQPSNSPSMLHCWLPGIAAALDFMHGHSVLHRDVKPANIFLDAFLKPYLGDFGIAKAIDDSVQMLRGEDLTAEHVAVGTAAYMAPEQFRRGEPTTSRVDQYALAVTVYEMLSGNRPFRGEREHIGIEHRTMAPPPLDVAQLRIPPSLHAAVQRALAKRPDQRFASCAEFARAALADVPPLRQSDSVARFLCPGCRTIIRLNVSRAGTVGVCMKCKQVLEVASDLSALWMRDEQCAVETEPVVESAGGMRHQDAEKVFTQLMERLCGAAAGSLGWLTSAGVAAVLAAACGGALAWLANEARWRSRFASEMADSKNELDRAEREIVTLRQQLQAVRAVESVPVKVADGVAVRSEDGSASRAAGASRLPAIMVDEDERGLPTAR